MPNVSSELNRSEVERGNGVKRNRLLQSLRQNAVTWTIMLTGLIVMASAEPLRHKVENFWTQRNHAISVEPDNPPNPGDQHHETATSRPPWIELTFYTIEHLGAVVFVAMIIRIAIEEEAQKKAVSEVSDAVRDRVDIAFRGVDDRVERFVEQVEIVNGRLEAIQSLTGGTLYGRRLTDHDRSEIKRAFLDPVFFRPHYSLRLVLKPADQNLMEVRIYTEAHLENITQQPQPLVISASLDNSISRTRDEGRRPRFELFEFGPNTTEGRDRARYQPFSFALLDTEHLKTKGYLRERPPTLDFSYDTGQLIRPGEIYYIKTQAVQYMRLNDRFIWTMLIATQNLELSVKLEEPLTLQNCVVFAKPVHHQTLDSIPASEDHLELKWQVKGIILPYQGVHVWWSYAAEGEERGLGGAEPPEPKSSGPSEMLS